MLRQFLVLDALTIKLWKFIYFTKYNHTENKNFEI